MFMCFQRYGGLSDTPCSLGENSQEISTDSLGGHFGAFNCFLLAEGEGGVRGTGRGRGIGFH